MYNDVFGNSTMPPSEFSYSVLNITVDTTLVWPYNTDGGSSVSKIMDVECAADNAITLPSAMEVSVGEDFLLRNVGGNLLEIKNAGGVTIGTVLAGAASYFYLTDNSTVAGVFGAVDFGVGTSSADAGTLVGAGIKAVGPTLNQSHPVVPTSGTLMVDGTHRAKAVVYTGGADTFNLTSAVTLGDDYFVLVRNNGTGTLVIDPAGAELIDGQANLTVQPSESLILICTGTTWYSVGYGRSTLYQFTQLTKDVSVGGTITLTAAEASNKLITFIGNPAAGVTVIVPAVVSVYYTYSNITTAQTVTLKTASGSGVGISQGARIIAICDATSVLSAQSAVANSSVSLTDGSAAVPALFFATQTNTGLYKFSTNGLGITVAGTSVVTVEATGLRTPQQIGTSVSTGTAPFIVASTTKVDNLHVARATIADSATTNANLTGPITSIGNATSVASQTGTGSTFVMNNSPTLVTPILGVASATSINKLAITAPATGSTLVIADAKTFTVGNTVTLTSTDGATLAIGGGGTLNSMAYQAANAVAVTGGTIDGTVIGGTTPAAGSFTTLTATTGVTANAPSNTNGTLFIGSTTTRAAANNYGIRFADSTYETNASIRAVQSGSGNNAASLVLGVNGGTGGIGLTSVVDVLSVSVTGLTTTGLTATGNTTLGDATTDTVTVNGYMGVGTAADPSAGVRVAPIALTGVDQNGVISLPTITSAANLTGKGIAARVSTAAATFTVPNVSQVYAFDSIKGAGSTITNQHGFYIVDQTQGTNNYGITSAVSAGTNKWNIYASGTAPNYFAGNVGVGVTPTYTLEARTGTSATLAIGRSGNVGATSQIGLICSVGKNASAVDRIWAGQYTLVDNATEGSESATVVWSAQSAGAYTKVMSVGGGKTLALQGATSVTGAGLSFPATQVASSDANTLDDYEEGTWTASIIGATTSGTYEISSQGCTYTKVGRLVTLHGNIAMAGTLTGGGAGNLLISGMPFAKSVGTPVGAVTTTGVAIDATAKYQQLRTESNSAGGTRLIVYQVVSSAAGITTQIGAMAVSSVFAFTYTYEV